MTYWSQAHRSPPCGGLTGVHDKCESYVWVIVVSHNWEWGVHSERDPLNDPQHGKELNEWGAMKGSQGRGYNVSRFPSFFVAHESVTSAIS